MNAKLLFWIFVILGVSLEIAGDIYFKKWVAEHRNLFLLVGFGIYALGAIFWALSLKYELLSRAISVFTVLNLIIIALVGVLFFDEKLSSVNKLGIGLGILSILLIEI